MDDMRLWVCILFSPEQTREAAHVVAHYWRAVLGQLHLPSSRVLWPSFMKMLGKIEARHA